MKKVMNACKKPVINVELVTLPLMKKVPTIKMPKNKIIFLGTELISTVVLEKIAQIDNIEISLVVTKMDKKSDHNRIIFSPIKDYCIKNKLPLIQPQKLILEEKTIREIKPDLIITCAYGLLVPDAILKIPKYRCINIHPSLLPKYRGPAPIRYALFNNDLQTGVTIMYMDTEMDTGDIILQEKIDISESDNYTSLYQRLSKLAAEIINANIQMFFNENIKAKKQDSNNATYTYLLKKEDLLIDWNQSIKQIIGKIKGLSSHPCAHTKYQNLLIKIYEAQIDKTSYKQSITNGTITNIDKNGIAIKCSDGILLITKIQLPNKNPVLIKDLINGHHIFKNNTCLE
jgi:methionyl-tRNA formyltransferase